MKKCYICGEERKLNNYGVCEECHTECERSAGELFESLFGIKPEANKEAMNDFYNFEERECECCVDEDIPEISINEAREIEFCDILNKMYVTFVEKNHDYGNSFSDLFDEFGLTSSAIRLTDKLNRFKTLIDKEGLVKDESIEDTLLDLANYAIMTIVEMKLRK